jgi:prohibitin 1
MHLGFSNEYAKAVERRAVQQQLAEMQKFIVLRDEELKNAQIIRSEAEA